MNPQLRRFRHAAFVLVAALAFGLCQGDRVLASGLPEREETGPFPKAGLFSVHASGQTGPVSSADDPAIWVHPTDPSLSVVIGTNKNTSGGLHVFNLQGTQLQFVAGGKHNNVDVRYGFMLGGVSVDLVSVCDRNNDQIDIYTIDPATRQLTQVGTIQAGIEVYGYAMYQSRTTGKFYGFVASSDGVEQWEFVDRGNGTVGGVRVRTFPSGHLIEGIAADDELGYLYLAEESQGIFKYYAEPDRPTTRLATVDVVGSATQLIEDVEGLTIYYRRNGTGYLIASSQGNDRFVVYRREGNNQYLGTFEVPEANSTDGIDVINMALGPLYPLGMFVAQNGDRDFQMVRWQDIANALGLAIDTQGYDVRGGSACAGVASVSVAPAPASVEVGATLQLSATPMDGGGASLAGCAVTWSTSAATVATVGASGLVTGVAVGPATITATSGGVSGASTITVVASTNAPPLVWGVSIAPVPEGASASMSATFSDSNAGDTHTASITWGDGSPAQPGTVNETDRTVTGSHVYANDGAYTVTVTVSDNRAGAGQAGATVNVSNVVPTANAGGPYSGVEGVPIQFSGSATDPGADVLTYEWDFTYNGTFALGATGKTVQHTYAQGTYTVGLQVRDDDGVSTVVATTIVTVAAPPVDTGLRSPTANAAVTSSAGDKNGFQTNPANAHADDGLFAVDTNSGSGTSTSCTSSSKDKHRFYNYGVSVPTGATIKGIEVRLDAKVDSTSGSPKLCVQLSWNGGATWTAAKATPRLTTSEATYMLGSATDTWGRSWTVGDLTDTSFRVRVISVASSTSRDFSLDWVAVRVTYQQ
jgi:myo-inositol-hexaphosphate 3-phosphohydrolase